ncbi:hypothetical protein CHS0354_007806 [Potamilus streckersoni]|uniref:C-type lectin domain-containing protein n=1 Tax=Potamilus streckersoni TaxID=2493646 RepID=A0AAE0VTF7_9BIVA|nr:hypothetical protein CHS0354_007806 [Potamilus streckersoni]
MLEDIEPVYSHIKLDNRDHYICHYLLEGLCCPEGFERHENRCYTAMELNVSWAKAKVYCSVTRGDLADIEEADENTVIMGIISRSQLDSSTRLRFWLDGLGMLAENEWRWMGQKGASRPMLFTNWKPPQTDNVNNNEN